jgi:hypothetical protein
MRGNHGSESKNSARSFLNTFLLFGDQTFCLEGSHATTTRRGDRLTVPLVLNVAGSEDTLHARLCRSGNGDDVAVGICLKLVSDKGGGGLMSDGVEETIHREVFLLSSDDVLDAEVVEEVAVTLALDCDGVPEDGDFGVVHETLGHDFRCAELSTSDKDIHMRAILGQIFG